MISNIRHFNIGFKTVAIILVLAIFATLIPTRVLTKVYAEGSGATLPGSDYAVLSEYPETPEGDYGSGEILSNNRYAEYEQLALEKLGQPATVESIDPYRRSDVSYQKLDFTNSFSRDYALKNGNHTRLVFGSPVNYKTVEGVWKKIDLTLHEQDGRYTTLDAPYTLSFAASSNDSNSLIDIDYNGASLSLTPLTSSGDTSEVIYEKTPHTDDELLNENPCENGTVIYDDIFSGSDISPSASLEYSIKPCEIKENIVIHDGGFEQYVYSFILSVNDCKAELKDGCILIYDETGNEVFKLTAEYMKDAKDECSDRVSLTLDETEGGFVVTVSADAEWINEEERVFPVRIDPTIYISYPDDEYAYEAVYVNGSMRYNTIAMGTDTVSYIKFDDHILDGISGSAVITHAVASLSARNTTSVTYTGACAFRSEMISNSWSPQTVLNGGTLPSVPSGHEGLTDSYRLTYIILPYMNVPFNLDVTDVLRNTFSGLNNGFMLGTECLSGTMPSFAQGTLVALQITYADHSGLNSYQSTHRISIDGSGTAYIKDINGDIIYIHPGISTKGEILPVSIDLVYSTAFKNTATDTYYGSGWRPSIIQTMKAETVTDINCNTYTYYVLTDGTGAKHYYTHSTGQIYKCEEYPIYEYNASTRTIDYHNGAKAFFNSSGYLIEYENEYGDSYFIGYSGTTPKITYVLDGNGVQLSFIYSQSKLIRIENDDCTGRDIYLTYSGSNLTKISSAAGESTNFGYSYGLISRFGYRKTSAETTDRVYVSIIYYPPWPNGDYSPCNIYKYERQSGSTYSMNECVSLIYADRTEYQYYYGNLSSPYYREYVYFDRNGRTVAVFDSLGNVSGSDYEGGDIDAMNLVSGQTSAVMANGNLVKDFTAPSGSWSFFSYSGSGSLESRPTANHFDGNKYGATCFKLSQNTANNSAAEVYASYPFPSAVTGKTYTLTADIDPSELNGSGEIVLGIKFSFYGMPNVKIVSPLKNYSDKSSIQYTFEIPSYASAGTVCIIIGVKNLTGSLYFDLVSLTEGALARPTNQLSDSSFYNGAAAWTVNGSFTPTVSTNDVIRSVIIPGNINSQRSLSQVLPSSVSDGGYLVVSGFGKGKAVSNGKFGISIHFNSSSSHDAELKFSTATKEWQFASIIIKIEGFSSDVTISLVNDYNYTDVCFGGITAEYIDSFGDYSDRSQYIYDVFGRISFERGFSGTETEYVYENTLPDRLSAVYRTDAFGNETSTVYSYSSNPSTQVIRKDESFAPHGDSSLSVDTYDLYMYNAHGKLVESATLSGNNYIAHKVYDYTSDGRFLHRETDSSGNDVTYSYSNATGDLLSVTDGSGSTTNYTYDSYGRLTGESEGSASFGITYGQYSTGISHNGFSYVFNTNNAGDMTSFAIQGANGNNIRTVAGYTYGGTFGQLSEINYGNGQTKYYGYDSMGHLTFVAFDSDADISTATFAWYYDDDGNVVKSIDRSDASNVITKQYSYDRSGELKYVLSSDGNKILYQYDTDESGKVEKEFFTTALTGREYSSRTETDSANRTVTKEGITGTKILAVDDLGRLSSFTHSYSSTSPVKSYSYVVKEKNTVYNNHTYHLTNETSLVSSETCSLSSVPTLSYTYYDNGKIKTISENGVLTNRYEYDAIGQLIREDNKKLNNGSGYTIKYVYDNGGNMVARMIFAYSPSISTASLYGTATLISFPIYGYNGTDKDLLSTFCGGLYFTYDAVGNPLTYLEGTNYEMTWTRGNKLATLTSSTDGYVQSYLYDADGLRTRKTHVTGANVSKQINYFWTGNTLRSEWAEDGSYEMVFDYDAAGRICGFVYSQYGGVPSYYRYIRNIQGDVTHIINSSGTVVATYTYDTWGFLISIKNGNGVDITNNTTSIGYINPIRYRGYYYDSETGFYYLQSRYYDPAIGRFLNADSQLNLQDGPLGANLYSYCGNDPVSGYDPEGTWDWGKFLDGLVILGTAVVCIASVAASIASCGTLTPLMTGVAFVTVAAAVAYAFEGVSEMAEAGTGYNYIKEKIFNGSDGAYEASKFVLSTVMQIGTAVIGFGVCFVAGTMVATAAGSVTIETITAGDYVYAYDEESGDVALKQVVRTFENEADELVHVTVNGEEIVCTNNHPFYSPVKGWTAACKLRAGDILVTVNGEYVVVEKIQHEILESPIKVYNFEVEGYHTYFVGKIAVSVHNSCGELGPYERIKQTGYEAHHIVEKRFAKVLKINQRYMPSVLLTHEEHLVFTNLWREAIPYGTIDVNPQMVWTAAKRVYKDYPELLELAMYTIMGG